MGIKQVVIDPERIKKLEERIVDIEIRLKTLEDWKKKDKE